MNKYTAVYYRDCYSIFYYWSSNSFDGHYRPLNINFDTAKEANEYITFLESKNHE